MFVTGNFAWYPEPKNSNDPDVLVVFGRSDTPRSSWRDFREDGVSPPVVFEIKSKSNTWLISSANGDGRTAMALRSITTTYDPERGTFAAWCRSVETGRLAHFGGARFVSPRLGLTFLLNGIALKLLGPDGRLLGDYVAAERAAEAERAAAETDRERAETRHAVDSGVTS